MSLRLQTADVRYWPEADILIAWANVRFRGVKRTSKSKSVMSAFDADIVALIDTP